LKGAEQAAWHAIVAAAAGRYRPAGRFAERFARGKLGHDPVFAAILAQGLIPDRARLVDVGCGQGLLEALLLAALDCHQRRVWPAAWPAPPRPASMWGIDLSPRAVRAAQAALGAEARVIAGDLRTADIPPADAIVLLDVLHYVELGAQEAVLARCRSALDRGGALLLRVADAQAGLRFWMTAAADRVATLARGGSPRLHCRPLPAWIALLGRVGFGDVRAAPMSAGTPFANVLIAARAEQPKP
jgi:SAM-dependent methyltransferase